MKFLINTSILRFGGAVQVALSFITECKQFPEHEYHVLVGLGLEKLIKKNSFPLNFYFYYINFGVISLWKVPTIQRKLAQLEQQIQPDCVITTSGPSYWYSQSPHVMGYNLGLYIYPESPYVLNLSFKNKLKLRLKRLFHFYFFKRDTTAYVTQTDDVNQRIRKALGTNKVHTVTNNHNGFYIDWEKKPKKLSEKKEGEIRFVTISAWYPHKNLDIILKVVDMLKERGLEHIKFILTISKEDYQQHIGDAYTDNIITIGAIKPEECPSFYDECDFLFLPTLAECFSASYPEAMVMQKPIITTDLGFARSICGKAALYYEAKNVIAAANLIEQLVVDKTLQNDLIKNGLEQLRNFDTPKERTRKYLALCQQLVDENKN